MPENPVMVVNIETDDFVYMHSIDASEAVKIGDHRYATPEEMREGGDKKTTALNRMRNVNVNPPPELQTDEQKQQIRAQARAEAEGRSVPEEPLGERQALGGSPVPGQPPQTPPPPPPPPPAEEGARSGRRPGSS